MALTQRSRTVLTLYSSRDDVQCHRARLVLAGVAVGLLASYFAVGLLSSLLYGVRPTDPGTFALVPAILAVVAFLAAVIPAARAARVDPIIAMRSE